jgi:hypothetical protein
MFVCIGGATALVLQSALVTLAFTPRMVRLSHNFSNLATYRMSQNLCHRLFLGIPHSHLSIKVPINMGPKVNRFQDIDLRSCAGIEYHISCSKC